MAVYIPEGDYVTPKQAAEMLCVSGQRLLGLVREGKLPSVKGNGIHLLPVEAVEERARRLQKVANSGIAKTGGSRS
jgi:hypothetical protein